MSEEESRALSLPRVEEKRIVQFVTDRANLGVGVDFHQLSLIIQELLIELKKGDKERYIPPTWEKCLQKQYFLEGSHQSRKNVFLKQFLYIIFTIIFHFLFLF